MRTAIVARRLSEGLGRTLLHTTAPAGEPGQPEAYSWGEEVAPTR